MNWVHLQNEADIELVDSESKIKPCLIFKHSTTCSISSMALGRIESSAKKFEEYKCYYLDLLKYRQVSNKISDHYKVVHESPQVLVIVRGECVYDESHGSIKSDSILQELEIFSD